MKKTKNVKKGKSNKFYILSLLMIVLTMSIGYAIFSEALNITGTASTTGTHEVEFSSTSVVSSTGCTPTSTISGDKNSLTIGVPNLAYPGATGTIRVSVKNTGNIDSKLISVSVSGNTDPDVVVTFPTFTTGTVLAAGETYTFDIVVAWKSTSSTGNKNVNFTATLNYEQSV